MEKKNWKKIRFHKNKYFIPAKYGPAEMSLTLLVELVFGARCVARPRTHTYTHTYTLVTSGRHLPRQRAIKSVRTLWPRRYSLPLFCSSLAPSITLSLTHALIALFFSLCFSTSLIACLTRASAERLLFIFPLSWVPVNTCVINGAEADFQMDD